MKKGQSKLATKPRSILRSSARSRFVYNEHMPGPHSTSPNQGLISSYNDTDSATVYKPADRRRTSSPMGTGATGRSDDPFRARGLGSGFGKQYTDGSMNYSEADRDLSPLRAEYSLSPLAHDLSPGRVSSPPPYTPTNPGYHGNTFTGSSYLSSRDHNSNVLSPSNKTPLYSSDVIGGHVSRGHVDLNKSNSSHYTDSKQDLNKPYYGNIPNAPDTPRVRRIRDNNLRQRMTDDNVPTHKSRSHSAGDPLEGGYSGRNSPRMRTPSAPANLNHSAVSTRDTPVGERVIPQTNHSIVSSANRSVFSRTFDRDPVLSRSIMSGEYRVRDPNRSALSSVSMRLAHDLDLSRSNQLNYSQSLTRDPVTHRKLGTGTPNGAAKLLRDHPNGLNQSKHSLDLSKTSLNNVMLFGSNYGALNSLVSLIFLALVSLVVAFLSVQLLFNLNARTATGIYGYESDSVLSNTSYENTHEVTIALTTFVLMLDICCLLVCSMQFFFAAKLAKCPQGQERCSKYLKECAATRFIAVTGFFISLPVLLLALMLYMLMEYHATPAIIAVVILSVGITFCIAAIGHSMYHWRVEKNKADLNIPAYEKKSPCSQSELSTLV